MSIVMKRNHSSTHTPSDYQSDHYIQASRLRHHRRSVDRVWPPALEIKLAQLSMDDSLQQDYHHHHHHHQHHHFHDHAFHHDTLFASSKAAHGSTATPSSLGSYIIPVPPPLDHEHHKHDDDWDTDGGVDYRSRKEDRRQRRSVFPLTPTHQHQHQHQHHHSPPNARTNIAVHYSKQSRKSPLSSPFLSPASLTHSPRRYPGGLEGFTKIVDSDEEDRLNNHFRRSMNLSSMHEDLLYDSDMIDPDHDQDHDQGQDQGQDQERRQRQQQPQRSIHTPSSPQPPRQRYVQSPNTAAVIIPPGFTFTFAQSDAKSLPRPRSQSRSRSRPHSHYSSSAPSPTTSFSPTISRRNSGSASPRTFMLQGFLARHSNGHIMHRKPRKCSSDCSSPTSSTNDEGQGDDEYECNDDVEVVDDEDDEEHDDRFLLLAQSPNLSEFDFGEFVTERQVSARKYQADSPVFFNGFPLLQMTPMKR